MHLEIRAARTGATRRREQNNQYRMELLAAISGLQALTETCRVTVITDSLYLQQGMTMYVQRWRRRNWLNSRGEAIANRDLWEQLVTAARRHETFWRWVRGHGSDPDQDRCDVLAQQCARSVTTRRRMAERVTLSPHPYIWFGRAQARAVSILP